LIHSDEVFDVKCFDRQETEDDDDDARFDDVDDDFDVNVDGYNDDDDGGKTDFRSEAFWKKNEKTFRFKTETKVVSRNESCFALQLLLA
jgi:hypothetical protein